MQLPQKLEDLKEVEQRREFQFMIIENNIKHLFQLALLGIAGIAASIFTSHLVLLYLLAGLTAISGIGRDYFDTN